MFTVLITTPRRLLQKKTLRNSPKISKLINRFNILCYRKFNYLFFVGESETPCWLPLMSNRRTVIEAKQDWLLISLIWLAADNQSNTEQVLILSQLRLRPFWALNSSTLIFRLVLNFAITAFSSRLIRKSLV